MNAVRSGRALFFTIAIVIATIDQLSKVWIEHNLAVDQSILDIGFFRITRIYNTGASFGLFPGQNLLMAVINLIGLGIIVFLVLFMSRRYRILGLAPVIVSLGLIAGGIVGNVTDRLTSGEVTDFIDFSFWPAFNVADSAITIGAVLLGLTIILQSRDTRTSPNGERT